MKRGVLAVLVAAVAAIGAQAADWPQWRGPERTGVSAETGLLKEWPKEGPKLRWQAKDIGAGYSTPSIAAGRVYVQTTKGNEEFVLALDEKTGMKVWEVRIGTVGRNFGPQYPGTRSTPTVDGERLYGLASGGELVCLEAATGKELWSKNLPKDLKGKVGAWAYSESVLIDGDRLICTPGGEVGALAALDKKSGKVMWQSKFPGGDVADYASIMEVKAAPGKEYVQFLRGGLAGVDAATGKFLWRWAKPNDPGANIMTPVVSGSRVFVAGSRTGGGLVELAAEGDGEKAREVYFDKSLAPSIGGAVLLGGNLYGTGTAGLFCAEFATGKVHWSDRSVGGASLCAADGRLYVRGHNTGEVALVEATAEGYREKGRFKQPERSSKPAWPHPVVANGGLYVRDQGNLFVYEVKAGQ